PRGRPNARCVAAFASPRGDGVLYISRAARHTTPMGSGDEVKAAIATLGGGPVVDFLVDPGAACRVLDATPEHGALILRVAPEAGAAAPGYGPPPVAPLWMRLSRGAREVRLAEPRGAASAPRRAELVEIDDREEPCCDAPGCEGTRAHAAVWLVLA